MYESGRRWREAGATGGGSSATLPVLWGEDLAEASREALGSAFDPDVLPGTELIEALLDLAPLAHEGGGSLTDGEVLELVAAWARVAASAESQLRSWAAVLAARPSMSPTWRSASGARCEAAADELALRLGVSRRRGQQVIDEGRALADALWPVDEALSSGRIDAGKAGIFVDALGELEAPVVVAACEQVLPVAGTLDHGALRRRIQQVIVQVDPDGAGERHRRAVRRRCVRPVRVLADGMAAFSAVLAAPDAVALEQACEASARAARAAGVGGTLQQLRADSLVALGLEVLGRGSLTLVSAGSELADGGTGVPMTDAWGRVAAVGDVGSASISAVVDREGCDGGPAVMSESMPSIPSSPSPVPADPVRQAADAQIRVGPVEAAVMSATPSDETALTSALGDGTAADSAPVVVRFSGRSAMVRVVATRAVQEAEPAGHTLADVAAWDLEDWVPDRWDAVAPGTEPEAAPDPEPPRDPGLDPGNDPYVDWSPGPTFRPGVEAPELVGYGAISPAVVRALAAAPWVVITEPVHPASDPPPDSDSYRPTAELDRFVRLRDVTCRAPGCHVPAHLCDVDHVVAWPLGPTSAPNLLTLCRRHHLLKTHAGHEVRRLADGTTLWRTALGQVLTRTADGIDRRGWSAPATGPLAAGRLGRSRAVPRLSETQIRERLEQLDADDDEHLPPVGSPWQVGVGSR